MTDGQEVRPWMATYPHGYDPLGLGGNTAAGFHEEAMPIVAATAVEPSAELLDHDRPEVEGTPAPIPEPGDLAGSTLFELPASGPVRPIDVRPDPADTFTAGNVTIEAGEVVQILPKDERRSRALVRIGATADAVSLVLVGPSRASALYGYPLGPALGEPAELFHQDQVWVHWPAAATAPVTIGWLAELARDYRTPSARAG